MSAFAPLLEAPTQGARQSLFVIPGIEDAIVATHMEALDHATVTRAGLRRYAAEQGHLNAAGEAHARSGIGTFETCRQTLRMSVHRGRPECAGRPARSRWCKSITMKE
jgi:hypothetical protein